MTIRRSFPLLAACLIALLTTAAWAQEQSVNPGINDSFRNPDVNEFAERFETESREVFARRREIVAASQIQPGQTVADIGAGTGLFTRLFATAVGPQGRVLAVDIAQNFLDHIQRNSREAGLKNVSTVLATADSTALEPASVDVAFICDTYHHFEFPLKTMASLHRALKPGGRVILIDFHRIEGVSREWTLNHVRAGQEVFVSEIVESGFRKIDEERELLKENYFVVFEKPHDNSNHLAAQPGRGFGRGPGAGRGPGPGAGRGPGADTRSDQDDFHFLLEHHARIRRTVKRIDQGVITETESDDPQVAAKIQQHVAAMHQRIKEGRPLRMWDELFAAIFARHTKISMTVEKTAKGVRVTESSTDPYVVRLIQEHADVVSQFVARGFEEAHKNHPVPATPRPADTEPKQAEPKPTDAKPPLVFPIIAGHGGVVPRPHAAEPPQAGARILFDATADAPAVEINKSLDRAARLLNLYGAAGLQSTDVRVAIVLHGEATKSALSDAAYQKRFGVERNPNLPLIHALKRAGVEVFVCGQALNYKQIADDEVADDVAIAVAALTVVMNKQAAGYAYLPVP